MTSRTVSTVLRGDRRGQRQVDELLAAEGIRRDPHLDYTCALFDEQGAMIATGSCYRDTLRCLAVRQDRRGEALLNTVVTHLLDVQSDRGHAHVFLYTSGVAAPLFGGLGFYEVTRVGDEVVFMENVRGGFARYLDRLVAETPPTAGLGARRVGAVVLNANPFSLGHRHLVEVAAAESDLLHVFVVSEDASLFPYHVRRRLVEAGTSDLRGLAFHGTGSYLVSTTTFPSYFLPDDDAATRGQARLDVAVFGQIAARLGITRRFVGAERPGTVTAAYNEAMLAQLPALGVACTEIPRLAVGGQAVSASTIRQAIHDGDLDRVRAYVPEPTWHYLTSPAAAPVLAAIRAAADVVHH